MAWHQDGIGDRHVRQPGPPEPTTGPDGSAAPHAPAPGSQSLGSCRPIVGQGVHAPPARGGDPEADESVGTPGSVPARGHPRAGDGHPSTTYVAVRLQRSTRELGRAALERSLSDLAPGGVYRAGPVTWSAGGLLHHRFTLTVRVETEASTSTAVCSLWHCPAGHPGWALPTTLPFGARTFLGGAEAPTRPSDRLVRRSQPTRPAPPPPTAVRRSGAQVTPSRGSSAPARRRSRRVCPSSPAASRG